MMIDAIAQRNAAAKVKAIGPGWEASEKREFARGYNRPSRRRWSRSHSLDWAFKGHWFRLPHLIVQQLESAGLRTSAHSGTTNVEQRRCFAPRVVGNVVMEKDGKLGFNGLAYCGDWAIGRIYETLGGLEHLRWFWSRIRRAVIGEPRDVPMADEWA